MRAARSWRWVGSALGLAAGGYAALVATAWRRYGHPVAPGPEERDPLLDRFMPAYEVVERHHIRVSAPAEMTLAAASEADLLSSPVVRAILNARALVLGAGDTAPASRPRGLLGEMTALGWVVLAETPGREIVLGAVTQPWQPDTVFRSIPPEGFLAFNEPGYVKIVWNLRADPLGPARSTFRTETRATTTHAAARARFRWYWARFSPGIAVIRWAMLGGLRRDVAARLRKGG